MIVVDALEGRGEPRGVVDQVTVERLDRVARDLGPLLGTTEALVQGRELGDAVQRIAERFKLVDLVAEQAFALTGLADRRPLGVEFPTQSGPGAEGVPDRVDDGSVDAEVVKEAALHVADQELAVFVLPVDVD